MPIVSRPRSTGARSYVVAGALLGEAVRALARHKGRTALAALGIAIGVAAVVWVVALGEAGARRARAQLEALGDDLVYVSAGSRTLAGVRTGSHAAVTLTADDAQAILAEVPRVRSVAVESNQSVSVVSPTANWTTTVRGISVSFLDTWSWTIVQGAAFTERDVEQAEAVALIGRTVGDQLFGDRDAVGQAVRIGSFLYRVVGVLGVKGMSPWGRDQDDVVLIPYTTAQRRIRGRGFVSVDDVMCRTVSPAEVKAATAEVTALLRERHHLAPGEDDDFEVRHFEEAANAEIEVSRTFANLLTSVACVALVVGGIGIMNMMLASVTERTREIGVRMSVGASARAVQAQFLVESVMLCVLGGLAGVAASAAGPSVVERVLGWEVDVPVEAVLLALGFSGTVGVLFGFYAALRAARGHRAKGETRGPETSDLREDRLLALAGHQTAVLDGREAERDLARPETASALRGEGGFGPGGDERALVGGRAVDDRPEERVRRRLPVTRTVRRDDASAGPGYRALDRQRDAHVAGQPVAPRDDEDAGASLVEVDEGARESGAGIERAASADAELLVDGGDADARSPRPCFDSRPLRVGPELLFRSAHSNEPDRQLGVDSTFVHLSL